MTIAILQVREQSWKEDVLSAAGAAFLCFSLLIKECANRTFLEKSFFEEKTDTAHFWQVISSSNVMGMTDAIGPVSAFFLGGAYSHALKSKMPKLSVILAGSILGAMSGFLAADFSKEMTVAAKGLYRAIVML